MVALKNYSVNSTVGAVVIKSKYKPISFWINYVNLF